MRSQGSGCSNLCHGAAYSGEPTGSEHRFHDDDRGQVRERSPLPADELRIDAHVRMLASIGTVVNYSFLLSQKILS
jgi:hypothetical protein